MVTFIDLNKQKKDKIAFTQPGDYVAFLHNVSRDFTFDIQEKGVNLEVYGLYVGRDSEVFTVNTTQRHLAPGSRSRLFIKGVFHDESKFTHKGLIRIEKKAAGTDAYQKNQNLKLSSKTFVESDPFLEILNNDVKCGHGSSTGRLNNNELYYLQTRGLSDEAAKKLLIAGFINEILEKVEKFGVTLNSEFRV